MEEIWLFSGLLPHDDRPAPSASASNSSAANITPNTVAQTRESASSSSSASSGQHIATEANQLQLRDGAISSANSSATKHRCLHSLAAEFEHEQMHREHSHTTKHITLTFLATRTYCEQIQCCNIDNKTIKILAELALASGLNAEARAMAMERLFHVFKHTECPSYLEYWLIYDDFPRKIRRRIIDTLEHNLPAYIAKGGTVREKALKLKERLVSYNLLFPPPYFSCTIS